jgi:hemerythrin-like domain-containing protein
MSKAIDDLRHEHEAILVALRILDSMSARIDTGGTVDTGDIAGFIGFLREFADKCHHGKEEGILFPALTRAGIPEQGGPVGVMLSEHVQGRKLIQDMEGAIARSPDYAKFADAARAYSDLLRAHISKENDVLFPMAERMLAADRLADIYDAFEAHEDEVIGHGRHEELHAILKGLKQRYLV